MQLKIGYQPKQEKIRLVIHLDQYDQNDHVLMQLIHLAIDPDPENRYNRLEYQK